MGIMSLRDESIHKWFDDRSAALVERFDFRCAQIHTYHPMPLMGKTGSRDGTYITQPEYTDCLHSCAIPLIPPETRCPLPIYLGTFSWRNIRCFSDRVQCG